jgi:NAD(P)-dependent dehydrogenase (short-subunit alcohol dehydrogenase family)
MAKIFITGSADGLGQLAANALIGLRHEVVLHARNQERAKQALAKLPGAADILIGDLSSVEETKVLAAKANALGTFDAVIHNAGVYQVPAGSVGAEGLPLLLTVNTLAPYILTSLMHKPQRLVYLSSGMHRSGRGVWSVADVKSQKVSYSDTKLHDLMLAKAMARKWKDVFSNAVDPGWVPTKMGGAGAPDDLQKGFETQVWLAVSDDDKARVSGHYFHHKKQEACLPLADDVAMQENLLGLCAELTGVHFEF